LYEITLRRFLSQVSIFQTFPRELRLLESYEAHIEDFEHRYISKQAKTGMKASVFNFCNPQISIVLVMVFNRLS